MVIEWFAASGRALVLVLASTVGIYAALVGLTRIAGLRSFSKMSSFDFAITVAVGSLIATVLVAEDPPLLQGVVALASLYAVQMALAILRYRTGWVPSLVDNEPLLLMEGTEVLDDNLRQASVTAGDLRAKLREANVVSLDQVEAVVMETTGDISVLHAPPEGPSLDSQLLAGVRR
jgi:uncharacterized membrane protein YcaP (DUF421 family)